jgi:hypothetical protein
MSKKYYDSEKDRYYSREKGVVDTNKKSGSFVKVDNGTNSQRVYSPYGNVYERPEIGYLAKSNSPTQTDGVFSRPFTPLSTQQDEFLYLSSQPLPISVFENATMSALPINYYSLTNPFEFAAIGGSLNSLSIVDTIVFTDINNFENSTIGAELNSLAIDTVIVFTDITNFENSTISATPTSLSIVGPDEIIYENYRDNSTISATPTGLTIA